MGVFRKLTARDWLKLLVPVVLYTAVSIASATTMFAVKMHDTEVKVRQLDEIVKEQGPRLNEVRENVAWIRGKLERDRD